MADKIAPGSWHVAPDGPGTGNRAAAGDPGSSANAAQQDEVDRLTARRDSARWSAVVGFALLFAGSFSSAFLFGGVAMIAYGAVASVYWSQRLKKVKGDPWDYDPDLDGPQAPEWARKGKPPSRDDAAEELDEP